MQRLLFPSVALAGEMALLLDGGEKVSFPES